MVIMDTIFHYYYTVPKRVENSDDEDAPAPIRDLVTKKGPLSEGKKSVGFGDSKPLERNSQTKASGTIKESIV